MQATLLETAQTDRLRGARAENAVPQHSITHAAAAHRWHDHPLIISKGGKYDAQSAEGGSPRGKAAALIALTGWGQDEDRRRSQEAGFDGHLVQSRQP